jgi:hypothetical protein
MAERIANGKNCGGKITAERNRGGSAPSGTLPALGADVFQKKGLLKAYNFAAKKITV